MGAGTRISEGEEAYKSTSLSEGEVGMDTRMERDRKGIIFSVINWILGMDSDSWS